jgi:alkylated DNA repair protein alkB family protein 8
VKAINEISRVLKPGGRALVTVWAKEQKLNSQESFYISKKGGKESEETNEPTNTDTNVHNFGKEFRKSDLFVSWRYNPKTGKNEKRVSKRENSENADEKASSQQVFLRYYHIFENSELEALFDHVSNARIVESFYEQGNWCVIFEKTTI